MEKAFVGVVDYVYGELDDTARVIEQLGIDENSVVLDVGCGTGTALIDIIKTANCKGIGVEPVYSRFVVAKNRVTKDNLEVELHHKHFPCNLELKPSHVILHACAFKKKNVIDVYNGLPRNVKILHNSLYLKRYAHNNQNNKIDFKTTYTPKSAKFWIHEK